MTRKLLIVFASGLVLSILLLSGAWAIGGKDMVSRRGDWNFGHSHDREPSVSKTLPFDGSQVLTIDAPVNLRFTRGETSEMIVEGPGRFIESLEWKDGKLSLGSKARHWSGALDVTITAPRLAGVVLRGAGDVELVGLDQPELSVDAYGAVDLDASGKVRTLAVASHGAGDLDLTNVDAVDATVKIYGVGDADIAASGKVTAEVAGAGDITLHRKPAELISRISGVGSVDHNY